MVVDLHHRESQETESMERRETVGRLLVSR
jgi:hypothetical protein